MPARLTHSRQPSLMDAGLPRLGYTVSTLPGSLTFWATVKWMRDFAFLSPNAVCTREAAKSR